MNERINQLEQYVFAKNRSAFVESLIKDTESQYYFSLLNAIDNRDSDLTPEQLADMKRYKKFRTASSKGIRVRYLFRKYDRATSDEEKSKIIEELNNKLFKIYGIITSSSTKKKPNANALRRPMQMQMQQQQQYRVQSVPIRLRNRSVSGSESPSDDEGEDSYDEIGCEEEEEEDHGVDLFGQQEDDEQNSVESNPRPIKIAGTHSSVSDRGDLFGDFDDAPVQQQQQQQLQLDMDVEDVIEPIEAAVIPQQEPTLVTPGMEVEEAKKSVHELDSKVLDVDHLIAQNSLEDLLKGKLNQDNIIRIPLAKVLAERDYSIVIKYVTQVGAYQLTCDELSSIIDHVLALTAKLPQKNQHQEISWGFHALTLKQMELIGAKIPDINLQFSFVSVLFLKKFNRYAELKHKGKELIAYLKEVYEWAKTLKPVFQSLQDQILFEILEQGIKHSSYELELFLDYIRNPKERLNDIVQAQEKKMQKLHAYDSSWHSVHKFESVKFSQAKLIKKYIKKYFEVNNSQNTKPFNEIFQEKYLEKMLIKVRLYLGDSNVQKVSKYFSGEEINDLHTRKELNILDTNAKTFAIGAPVSIALQIKNIDKLNVKIFNFQPENYYLKFLAAFNNHIDLDGLNPSEEVSFEFKDIHACTRIVKSFDFESIQKTPRGIFIVEFFSSGIASRAIIYKGTLSHFSRNTIAGQEVVILDEQGTIQRGERVGMWFQNTFHKADENGRIMIPYSVSSQQSHQAILVSGDFAALANFVQLAENYTFQCDYIYNQEQFIFGNKVRAVIQPLLMINSELASLSLLKDTEISIVTITTEDVPSTTRLNWASLTNDQDILIEFNLPAKTKQVRIDVSTKLTPMTKAEDQKFSSSHTITIDQHLGQLQFASAFLQFQNDQYHLLVLGKNGEPLPNYKVNLRFQHKIFVINFQDVVQQQTNEQGRILLGKLENVIQLTANSVSPVGNGMQFSESWNLERKTIRGIQSLPKTYELRVGGEVSIPLIADNTNIDEKDLRLNFVLLKVTSDSSSTPLLSMLQSSSYNVLSNELNNSLKIVKVNENDSLVVVGGLAEGVYILHAKNVGYTFAIRVHADSEVWTHSQSKGSESILLGNDKNLLLNFANKPIKDQIRVESFSHESSRSTIKLNHLDDYSNVRVHIVAAQFFPSGLSNPLNKFSSNYDPYQTSKVNLKATDNKYMSNRQLGDEFAYVLDRKVQTRFTGNLLEKPSLSLKRQLLQNTQYDKEQLVADDHRRSRSDLGDESYSEGEDDDDDADEEEEVYERDLSYCMSPKVEKKKAFKPSYRALGKGGYGKSARRQEVNQNGRGYMPFYSHASNAAQKAVNANLNFLKKPSLIIANLTPNKAGLIQFEGDLSSYSCLQVILRTPSHQSVSAFNISAELLESRDLRQKSVLAKDKHYAIFRKSQKISKGESAHIDDITSTEFQIVDSLNKVFDFQSELSRFEGTFVHESSKKSYIEEWEFLKKWDTLSLAEKQSKYNSHISHELNFFVYMKDPSFFDSIVVSHIANKLQPTLIDYFLLGQYDALVDKYYHVELLGTLSIFELCLLVYIFASHKKQKDEAQRIAELISAKAKANVPNKESQKKYFEIILNKNQTTTTSSTTRKPISKTIALQSQQLYSNSNNNGDACSESLESSDAGSERGGEGCFDDFQQCDEMIPMSMMANNCEMDDDFCFASEEMVCQKESEQRYDLAMPMKSAAYNFNPLTTQYKNKRQLFQSTGESLRATGEYAERQHYNSTDNSISSNTFWKELALSLASGQAFGEFMSSEWIECTSSHTEMILLLALLSLPFTSPNHTITTKNGMDQSILASDNLLLFTKEIRETVSNLKAQIMINQRFFDPSDKFEVIGDEKYEKNVEQFVVNNIYGCQVIVTNCTGGQQEIQVLTEVPEGSIPVHTIEYTKSHTQVVDAYCTKILEFYFYFPVAGVFTVYPANASKNGEVLSVARQQTLDVKHELKKVQLNTLDQVIMQGTKDDILSFLRTKDWQEAGLLSNPTVTFKPVESLCVDKEFFLKLVEILREKRVFLFDIWKYSLKHLDHTSLVEFTNSPNIRVKVSKYISHIQASLVKSSLNIGQWNQIYEYYPLFNSRVHLLKRDDANILNKQFRNTYAAFLKYIVEKGLDLMDGVDRMVFVYYLLLQDRVEAAIEQFEKIDEAEFKDKQGKIQFDYLKAYLDFFKGYPNFKIAREIIEQYLDYPVTSWRNLFYEIANQLAEYDGEDLIDEEMNSLTLSAAEQAKKEESQKAEKLKVFQIRFEGTNIILEHKNVPSEVTLLFFKIDLEVFFSKKPFLSTISEDFSYLQPTFTQVVKLNEEQVSLTSSTVSKFELPEHLRGVNVYIQAASGPFLKTGITYFSTQLKVSLFEEEAQLKISDANSVSLSKIYVKVFARTKSKKIEFIKDGYTDLRGRFDYLVSSTVNLNDLDKLSIFIMSDDLGSLILEAQPPKRTGTYKETVQLKSKQMNAKYQEKVQMKRK